MKCLRCNKVEIPGQYFGNRRLTVEESRELQYCYPCLRVVRFENAKYVLRPYKIPIDRKIL